MFVLSTVARYQTARAVTTPSRPRTNRPAGAARADVTRFI
jgi:hypothetical protein